jgi:hypothetical protein
MPRIYGKNRCQPRAAQLSCGGHVQSDHKGSNMVRLVAIVFGLVLAGAALAVEPVKSGHQPGQQVTAIFEPLNVTGEFAGQPHCLVCENGTSPVVMVFAREVSEPLLKLAAQLDAATGRHKEQSLGSFVVVLSEAEGLDERLAESAKKRQLKRIVLAIDKPAGPDGFHVAAEADVTVVLYREFAVKANHAFRKGELNDKAIEKIVADIPKILPAK